MGDDFFNRMCFIGEARDAMATRASLIEIAHAQLTHQGFRQIDSEDAADRCLTFGPPGRWLFIGDTAGSTMPFLNGDYPARDVSRALTRELSRHTTVLTITMSDSCCAHLSLWDEGGMRDILGNGEMPFGAKSEEARAKYGGRPREWLPSIAPDVSHEDFKKAWHWDYSAFELVRMAVDLLGLHPRLSFTGYSVDWDGIFARYDPEDLGLTDADFTESYWVYDG